MLVHITNARMPPFVEVSSGLRSLNFGLRLHRVCNGKGFGESAHMPEPSLIKSKKCHIVSNKKPMIT